MRTKDDDDVIVLKWLHEVELPTTLDSAPASVLLREH